MSVGSSSASIAGRGVAARLLGERLRRLRCDAQLSLADAATLIRGSSSKLSRLERGESPPKENDVWDLVRHYGLDAEGQDEIHELLSQVRDESKRRKKYSDLTPDFVRRLIALEGQAKRICVYETHVVPGLLQTKNYARVLVGLALEGADYVDVSRHVQVRRDRQALFDRPRRPELIVIIDESVLRRPIGGPEVMCEQLRHLRKFAGEDAPDVHFRILPFEHENVGFAPSFPITHLQFADGGPAELVYVEQMESADYVTTPEHVRRYRKVLDELMATSLSREDTLDHLDRRLAHYEERAASRSAEFGEVPAPRSA
ncbi:helix-turn-helix domain-containing protein [Streptomyces antimicrobicus]|uniref:Helix-turn-helix domain-containing protein n=1 Tax=Streptomyces antimicrobicus TaxID=2883108 RepID=A0ABS8B6T7_9ACTN|nr:helix-turn-helix transcriptional regulator [Streptomyces antimicrobicus]MCB5180328.1 helix-turn-helix domain-containing protein [Streptomyces antimicrobicus]